MEVIRHSLYLAQRGLRNLARQPWFVALTLVQPLIWLLLYGQLFKRVVELPGFDAGSYISFLAPGVVVMTALFGGGWNGMGMIADLDRGVMDRLLVSPVNRAALVLGRLISLVVVTVIQSTILLLLAFVGVNAPQLSRVVYARWCCRVSAPWQKRVALPGGSRCQMWTSSRSLMRARCASPWPHSKEC